MYFLNLVGEKISEIWKIWPPEGILGLVVSASLTAPGA